LDDLLGRPLSSIDLPMTAAIRIGIPIPPMFSKRSRNSRAGIGGAEVSDEDRVDDGDGETPPYSIR